MRPQFIRSLVVLLTTCLCSACASKALAPPPRCDLTAAVPINMANVPTMSDASAAVDTTEDAASRSPESQDEVPGQ